MDYHTEVEIVNHCKITYTMQNKPLAIIILAAGKGTRMKSDLPKVLHPLQGKPILEYVINTAKKINPKKICVIAGYKSQFVIDRFSHDQNIEFAIQKQQLGTAHAVLQAKESLKNFDGNIIILSGDVPLLRAQTLTALITSHIKSGSTLSLISAINNAPTGYGRIVRKKTSNNLISAIVEEKDLTEKQREIKEINAGIYLIESTFLFDKISCIQNINAQSEYYLTDIIAIAVKSNIGVNTLCLPDSIEISGINSKQDLQKLEESMSTRQ